MKRPEVILSLLVVFFILWVFTCITYPFVGLIILSAAVVIFLGFIVLALAALWYSKK
jgi:hypothetical protein